MKKSVQLALALTLIATIVSFTMKAISASAENDIRNLVEKAYIHGAFNELNPEAMADGFHKDFAIFSAKGEELNRYEISDWVEGVRKRKNAEDFDPDQNVWKHKFDIVDVTDGSAVVKVELMKDGKHIFTDYLSLLKFDSGWKIVAKVYTRHE